MRTRSTGVGEGWSRHGGNLGAGSTVTGIMRPMHIRRAALPTLATLLAVALTGCGREDDGKAADPASEAPTPGTTTSGSADDPTDDPTEDPTTKQWPDFAATDYTYRLEVLCFCPLTGPLKVTVADGEVTSATRLTKPGKGTQAPGFARLTINDLIAKANDPSVFEADVTWPAGTDHPTKLTIDQIENAVDDEVTYTVSNVQVTPVSAG